MSDASAYTQSTACDGIMMQAVLRLSSGVLAVSLTYACSSLPPRVSPTQPVLSANQIGASPSSPAPSVPRGASSGGASAPDRPPDAASPHTDADNAMRKRGYMPALYRGERVYCRNEALTGSNLQSRVCLTASKLPEDPNAREWKALLQKVLS